MVQISFKFCTDSDYHYIIKLSIYFNLYGNFVSTGKDEFWKFF